MSFASKYNKGGRFGSIDLMGYGYVTLSALFEKTGDRVYVVQALMVNKKSKYGAHPVIVAAPDLLIDCPKHMMNDVESILDSSEDCELIRAGKVGFRPRPYRTKSGLQAFSVEWVDL